VVGAQNAYTAIKAVIFDMDGVITDSELLYGEAVNAVFEGTRYVLTDDDHRAIMGSSIDYTWDWIMRRFDLPGPVERWTQRYDDEVVRLLTDKAEPTPGIYELLDAIQQRHVRLGLASSSQHNWVMAVLGKLGLQDRFEAIASCEMAANAKPAPDLYVLAGQKLGVVPGECMAVEDTPRGIQAAKAAGIYTVALRTGPTAALDISAADLIIDSLGHFPLHRL